MPTNPDLAFDSSDPNAPAIRQLISESFLANKDVSLAVSLNDDMYAYSERFCGGRPMGAMAYFRAGLSILDCVKDIVRWRFGPAGFQSVGSFLDFASGHGRFTRFLTAMMPANRIHSAEILPDAVRFQNEAFGVNSLQSTTEPEEFECDRTFDCIFVASLFTHLPDRTFESWLRRLYSLLSPVGILIFSVHGQELMPSDDAMPAAGIYFRPESEIPSLDAHDYGATIVTQTYVENAIRLATGKAEFRLIKRGLCFTQDVYVISNHALPSAELVYDHGPQGHLDVVRWTKPRELRLEGWAADICSRHAVTKIYVTLNGEGRRPARISVPRPDVVAHFNDPENPALSDCGFAATFKAPRELKPFDDVLSVVAVCAGGKSYSVRTVVLHTALDEIPDFPRTFTASERLASVSNHIRQGEWGMLRRKLSEFIRLR